MIATPLRATIHAFCATALFTALQTQSIAAQSQSAETRPTEITQTIFLNNANQQSDLQDVQTALRNMLPNAHIYGVATQNALTIHATADAIAQAQKLVAELDRPHKVYRLTYSITESDAGKPIGTQHVSLIVFPGRKAFLKQGTRVPILTSSTGTDTKAQNSQVQYLDVGLNIDASVEGSPDDLRLQTTVEQSNMAEEKSSLGVQDPIIRQTTLQSTVQLSQSKPLLLGALDIPGSTRHQEIEVVSEVVK